MPRRPGWRQELAGQGMWASLLPGFLGQGAAFSGPRIPTPLHSGPCSIFLLATHLCPRQALWLPLRFIPVSCLILPEFYSPSSTPAWQPLTFQLPGNPMTIRPGLFPHTAVRQRAMAGTGDQPRTQLQGPKSGHRHPPSGPSSYAASLLPRPVPTHWSRNCA